MSKRIKAIIFLGFFICIGASLYFAADLRFGEDLSSFFPDKDEDLEFYETFQEKFPSGKEQFLLGIQSPSGVFEEEFLKRVGRLVDTLETYPEVSHCLSLTHLNTPQIGMFGVVWRPLVQVDDPGSYPASAEKILQDERLVNTLIDSSASATVVAIALDSPLTTVEFLPFLQRIKNLASTLGISEYHFLGNNYLQAELYLHQQKDIQKIALMAMVTILVILIVIFRRFWGILIALSTVFIALVIFAGYLGLMGFELNSLSPLFPVLILIVGTSDVIHLLTKYAHESLGGKNRREAIRVTLREIGKSVLLTSVTTAIGFASLVTSNIVAIREFGINAAVGVIIAYFTSILWGCALVSSFDGQKIIRIGKPTAPLNSFIDWFYRVTRDRKAVIGGAMVLVFLISAWGVSRVKVDYKLRDALPKEEAVAADLDFFEEKFGGYRILQIAVNAGEDLRVDDFAVVREVEKLEKKLKTYPGITGITSLNTVYKSVNRARRNDLPQHFKLPKTESAFEEVRAIAQVAVDSLVVGSMSEDGKFGVISGRIKDLGSAAITQMNDEIDNWGREELDSNVVTFRHTGNAVILDKNARYIRSSLLSSLGIAIVVVSLLMVLLFRSFPMLIISLVPNLFPLLMTAAMLGFLGIDLNANVTILFTVVFGIAVDDTIHFLSRIKLALGQGLSLDEAIKSTFKVTGKAIVQTSVILFFGFFVLVFSSMPHTVTMGVLMSLTLAFALFFDFFMIPVLLRVFLARKK